MKVFLILAILFVFHEESSGFACTSNFCDIVKCDTNVKCDNETEIFVAKGSTCHCCDACYKKLGEGEVCVPRFSGGTAFLAKCGEGLICGPDKKCIKS